jgi:hypothetical protein
VIFPTGVVLALPLLPNADVPGAGVDGFPNADDPKPEEPNPEDDGVVVDTGFENALGVVDDPKVPEAGVDVGGVEAWPKLEDVPNAVAGLM